MGLNDQSHWLLHLNTDRTTGTGLAGASGSGKTSLILACALQDIAAGRGVALLDPHGDLYEQLLLHLAIRAGREPPLAERVVLVNPLDRYWTVGFNPLAAVAGYSTARLAAFLTDVVIKIWGIDTTNAPRLVRLLMFTFYALAELKLTLADLVRFLVETAWRETLLLQVQQPEVRRYFQAEFPKTAAGAQQWIAPVLNKVGMLMFDPDLRMMFSTPATLNFRQILDEQKVLLVNLSEGQLGKANSALLGAFMVAHLQKAALARADSPHRPPFYVYLDEAQSYGDAAGLPEMLTAARKYNCALTLSFQYLEQLSPDLRAAVRNTVGTLICFRVGYADAAVLAHELFPPEYVTRQWWELNWGRVGKFPVPFPHKQRVPLDHTELVHLLTQLPPRVFVARRRGPYPPVLMRTLDMPPLRMTAELAQARAALIRTSMQRYGRLKSEVIATTQNEHSTSTPPWPDLEFTDYEDG